MEVGVQMGTQVSQKQLDKILQYIEIGKEEGATVLTGGYKIYDDGLGKGAFIAPTILSDVDNKMRVSQEEIFGPVATIVKFKDEEEVIRLANDSIYGLGGGLWTSNLNKALNVARQVKTGSMWINQYANFSAGASFGSYKRSGIGRETYKSMPDSYTNMKNIFISTKEEKDGMH